MQANEREISRLLKTVGGQVQGILRMVEENRYCMDILCQLQACQAILRRAQREILEAHLRSCVLEAFSEEDAHEKIEEIIGLLKSVEY